MRPFVLLIALVLAACAKVDPPLAALVPADTVLLAGVRVEALEKTGAFRIPQLDDFARQTGIDLRKDLSELLYFSNGRQGALLGRGNFDSGKASGVVVLDAHTAAAGETAALKSLLDQHGKSPGPPAALAALMREVPPEAQVWAAYSGGAINLPLGGNVEKLLGALQDGTAYFDLRTGVKGVASGLCSTEQQAQDVAGALKLLIALERLDQSLQVTEESRRVKVTIDAPPELVEKFLDLWTKR